MICLVKRVPSANALSPEADRKSRLSQRSALQVRYFFVSTLSAEVQALFL